MVQGDNRLIHNDALADSSYMVISTTEFSPIIWDEKLGQIKPCPLHFNKKKLFKNNFKKVHFGPQSFKSVKSVRNGKRFIIQT